MFSLQPPRHISTLPVADGPLHGGETTRWGQEQTSGRPPPGRL